MTIPNVQMHTKIILCIIGLQVYNVQVFAQHQCAITCEDGCDVFTRACYNCTSNTYDRFCDSECSGFCSSSCDRYTGNCDSCKDGKYATWCLESCSAGCTSGCDMETGHCVTCKTGWYGDWCNVPCPSGCDGGCNRVTGDCLSCDHGYFGRHCNVACRESGCTQGCDQYYGTCKVCPIGFYGNSCEKMCGVNCKQSECDSFTEQCIDCKDGIYGTNCAQPCPENCNGNCNFQTGNCYTCKTGYYGRKCTSKCPNNCQGPCDQTGECISCMNGFYGRKCLQTCSTHCLTSCDQRTGGCYVCEDRFSGEFCNNTCEKNCIGPCHKNTSVCISCEPGWFGRICDQQCSANCRNMSCTPTGTCFSCSNGFYGESCEMDCHNCVNDTCRQPDGQCLFGCLNNSKCNDGVSSTTKTTGFTYTKTTNVDTVFPTDSIETDRTFKTRETTSITNETASVAPKKPDNGKKISTTVIIVIVLLVLLLVCACIGVIVYFIYRKKFSPSITHVPLEDQTHEYDELENFDPPGDYEEPVNRQGFSGDVMVQQTSYGAGYIKETQQPQEDLNLHVREEDEDANQPDETLVKTVVERPRTCNDISNVIMDFSNQGNSSPKTTIHSLTMGRTVQTTNSDFSSTAEHVKDKPINTERSIVSASNQGFKDSQPGSTLLTGHSLILSAESLTKQNVRDRLPMPVSSNSETNDTAQSDPNFIVEGNSNDQALTKKRTCQGSMSIKPDIHQGFNGSPSGSTLSSRNSGTNEDTESESYVDVENPSDSEEHRGQRGSHSSDYEEVR